MKYIVLLVIVIGAGLAYVRLASSDPGRWHVDLSAVRDPGDRGDLRRVTGDLAALDKIIRAEPRVRVLGGTVGEGHITYIVRSKVFGFPDYVTVQQDGADLVILSRLRFGLNDVGVNRARLDRWLKGL